MSNDVYPDDLPGLAFSIIRTIVPPPVSILTTPSAREYRSRDASLTRIRYTLPYEFLRSDPPHAELSTIVNFYNDHGGPFDSWLFLDPDDSTVSGQLFGTGNGSATVFQLTRQFGGSNSAIYEPVFDLAVTPEIHFTGVAGTKINLLAGSDAFDLPPWSGPATVTANTTLDPFGSTRADTIADTSSSDVQYRVNFSPIYDDGQDFRFSVFVKQTTGNTAPLAAVRCTLEGGPTPVSGVIVLDTDTGVVAATVGDITSVAVFSATNGFWRVNGVLTNNQSGNFLAGILVYPSWAAHASGTPAVGNVSTTGSAIFYGAKIEVGATLTAYTAFSYSEAQGLLTISPAPGANQKIYWNGQFYRRCRFVGESLETNKFMDALWSAQKVEFIQTRS